MTKIFISILASLSLNGWAQKTTEINCTTIGESFGQPTTVQVTITLTDIPGSETQPTDILAVGSSFTQFSGTSESVISEDNSVKIYFISVDESIAIDITLEGELLPHQRVQLIGPGLAEISPSGRLQPVYSLRNCQGIL